jgi:hypothetical protein
MKTRLRQDQICVLMIFAHFWQRQVGHAIRRPAAHGPAPAKVAQFSLIRFGFSLLGVVGRVSR